MSKDPTKCSADGDPYHGPVQREMIENVKLKLALMIEPALYYKDRALRRVIGGMIDALSYENGFLVVQDYKPSEKFGEITNLRKHIIRHIAQIAAYGIMLKYLLKKAGVDNFPIVCTMFSKDVLVVIEPEYLSTLTNFLLRQPQNSGLSLTEKLDRFPWLKFLPRELLGHLDDPQLQTDKE